MKVGASIVCVSMLLMSFQPPIGISSINTDGPTFPLEVSTDKYYYTVGETVNITLKNVGDEIIQFPWYPWDKFIVSSEGQVVVDTELCWPRLTLLTEIDPGSEISDGWGQGYFICDESNDPVPPSGDQVPPGKYRISVGFDTASYGNQTMPIWDSVWIEIGSGNSPPVADAGLDQTVHVGDIVQFDGSGSYYPDGDFIFSPGVLVNDVTTDSQGAPRIAVDPDGNIHVVWVDRRDRADYETDVYYSKSINGGLSFEPSIRVNDGVTKTHQSVPVLSINDNMDILVAWTDGRDYVDESHPRGVYFAKSTDGGQSFGTNVKVNDYPGAAGITVHTVAISSLGTDDVFLTWEDTRNVNDVTGVDIYFSKSTEGGKTFGPNVRVNDDQKYAVQFVVSMDVDSEGNVYVIWTDTRVQDNYYDIYFSKSTDGGLTFEPDVRVDDADGFVYSAHPDIALDSEGNINVVWDDERNPPGHDIYFSRSTDGGSTFGENVRVTDRIAAQTGREPSLAVDSHGDIYAAWYGWDNGSNEILFSFSTDGGETFRKNIRVNNYTDEAQINPAIAVDQEGIPHIVWKDERHDFGDIYYAKGSPVLTYDWNFDDGSPRGTGKNPIHIYDKPGVYNVTLTVTDAQGASDSDNCIITVLSGDQPPIADAGLDQTVNEGDVVQFDGSGSYDPGANWVNMTVDSADDVGKHVSIAIDSNDNPHIAYKDDTNDYVKYAQYPGGAWDFEMVDAIGKGEETISLALDSNDRPRISYYDSNDDILKYAMWNGLAWETEVVDSTPGSGFWNSMALDSNDWAHISYYYGYPGRSLKYAKWNGSDWEIETVDSSGDYVGWYNSIAVDSKDRPHISYRDETNEDLKYARWTGSSWSIETVDAAGRKGLHTSIALDSYDNPHISYSDSTDWTLKYASWTGSMWNIEVADSVDHVGFQTSIALDSYDNPHISYNDMTNCHLKYAKRTGGSWNVERVDIDHNVMWETSIALDSYDNPHITYTNWGVVNYDLKYANKRGGIVSYDWDFDGSVDSDGDGNQTNDIDATGPTPTHVYGDNEVYTVTLKVTDNSGLWDTDTTIVTVLNVPPVAGAGGPYIGFEGSPIVVTGNHTDPGPLDTHTYEWDFSYDGTTFISDATGNPYQKAWYDDYTGNIALKVTDDDGGWDLDVTNVTIANVPPRADAGHDKEGFEVSTFTFDGSCSDPGTLDTHTYEWDFDYDGINFDADAIGQSVTHTWIDDFDGNVALRVTDDDGGVGIDTVHVLVKNVPPTVELRVLPIEADAFLRIAGEKWHDASIELYEDDVLIAEGTLTRYPGSPNDQMLDLTHLSVNISRKYSAIVRYTPENDPINGQPNGANPCWIILKFDDGEEIRLHHTFNVQHPERYVWEVDLTAAILSRGLTFEATVHDPGADDLTLTWDFGDGTVVTTSYPNLGGTYPVDITVTIAHVFPGSGTYTITLTVEDDDGGTATASLVVSF